MNRFVIFFALIFSCNQEIILARENDISFVLKIIKEDYPGYKDKARGKYFDQYAERVIHKYPKDTFRVLSLLVNYFNDQHLVVYQSNALKYIIHDSLTCQKDLKMLNEYFSNNIPARYEGYWINDRSDYVIAIKQVNDDPKKMVAYAIETRNNALPSGVICHEYEQIKNNHYQTNYITIRGNRIFIESDFRNDYLLTTGAYGKWKKLTQYSYPALPSVPTFDYKARGKLLDSNNFLITIPGNSDENTALVNEIVRQNRKLIASTPNLIIDIRNNMGGTIATYDSLLPFIYTKPIYQASGHGYYSKAYIENLKNRLTEYVSNKPQDLTTIKELQEEINRREGAKGKTVLNKGYIFKFDSVMTMPKNVALIANYACQSAAEMMILDFKQSSKVTLFGEHTMGVVDYLSNFTVELPSKKYRLMIPASKRVIPNGQFKIDGVGIYPDVPISDSTNDWVNFVQKYYLEERNQKKP
jgi:hypothetical protein